MTKNLFLIRNTSRIGAEEPVLYFPLIHILANASLGQFILDRGLLLGPRKQAFKIELIAVADHDIADCLGLYSPADGPLVYAKKPAGLGDRDPDDIIGVGII